jgi:hypothetical protein
MTTVPDSTDFLMQGSSTGAQFPKVGHSYSGTILQIGKARQQTDMQDKKPKFFDDGVTPRMQVPVTLATNARGKFVHEDPNDNSSPWVLEEIPDDDGVRTLWVAADMQRAIRDAVVQARKDHGLSPEELPGPQVGGHLTVTRGKSKQSKKTGWSGQHTFTAVYVPKAANAGAQSIMDDRDPFNQPDAE